MKPKKAWLISFNGKSYAGGVERVVYYLDEYLHSRGIETKLIDEDYLVNHTLLGRLFNQLFRYRHFKKRKAIYLARYTSAFLWLTRQRGRVVISQGESVPFFPADVAFIHGSYHCMEVAYGRTASGLSRMAALQQRACKIARKILAVSARVKADLVQYYGTAADKITVVNNCVDTSRFHPFEKRQTSVRTLLYVGRMESAKGMDVLLKLAPVIEQSEHWQLLIACNKSPNSALFNGFTKTTVKEGLLIDNIAREAYALGDLLILPSKFEGFELVTLEALSVGIPVVGNHVGAIGELKDRGFPGVHLLPDMSAPDAGTLACFDEILTAFERTNQPGTLHGQVTQEFGIDRYFEKLDLILEPLFFRTTGKSDAPAGD